MNVLQITENHSLKSGGLRTVINDLNVQLNNFDNINSYILSSEQKRGDGIELVESSNLKLWLYSKKWKITLGEIVISKKIDVIHIHGVWMYPQYIAAKFAIRNNIPFIISPHGMYEPWLWTKGRLKKSVYFNLLVKFQFLYDKKYNTHNQYLSFILSVGIVGLVLILGSFYFLVIEGIKNLNFLFLSIFIFYLIQMFTENILERENGVIYFSFFTCFLQVINTQKYKV